MPNVILIVCGSAASWMLDKVINNKGGLHGRITREICLQPFTLFETEEYLREKQITLDKKQILELYMCLGGVAKYLSYLERGKSAPQLIGELCFSLNAPLISEFHNLYRSLFHHYEEHEAIVKALATSHQGLTYQNIAKKTGLSVGGGLSKRLKELKASGFITEIYSFGQTKSMRYVLIDEYSLFYLTWNAGISALDLQSRAPDYWIKQQYSQAWKVWTGHVFECLCLKHIDNIKAALGLRAVQTQTTTWSYIPPKNSKESGAEIDLVIDRKDQCINLCEIKYYTGEFSIDKEYAQKLQKKKECFLTITQTEKPIFMTLITTQGTKHNDYYHNVVDQEVTMNALFAN